MSTHAVLLLIAASFVLLPAGLVAPGLVISRRRKAEAEGRDPLPEPLPELEEGAALEARWDAYWAASRAYDHALLADLNDHLGATLALEEDFAAACDQIVKRFAVRAIERQAAIASAWGGWDSDIERRADLIVEACGHSLAAQAHRLAVEVAECTSTQWTEADGAALAAHIDAQGLVAA